jgi:Autotransporter beta-domain
MRWLIGATAALLALSSTAMAQGAAHPRQGFTISFGLGGGSAGLSCEVCSTDRENGLSGYLRIGGAVRPNLIVAGESHGWTKSEGTTTATIGYLTAVAQWYPNASGGFHVSGGLGMGMFNMEDTDPTFGGTLESVGVAYQLGAGYDWRVGRNFSLTPYLNFLGMGGGEPKFDGAGMGGSLNANIVQIGLGFSWH